MRVKWNNPHLKHLASRDHLHSGWLSGKDCHIKTCISIRTFIFLRGSFLVRKRFWNESWPPEGSKPLPQATLPPHRRCSISQRNRVARGKNHSPVTKAVKPRGQRPSWGKRTQHSYSRKQFGSICWELRNLTISVPFNLIMELLGRKWPLRQKKKCMIDKILSICYTNQTLDMIWMVINKGTVNKLMHSFNDMVLQNH